MKIRPEIYQNNRFETANQARCYQRAREMEATYNSFRTDILSLDNGPLDRNSESGKVVMDKVALPRTDNPTMADRLNPEFRARGELSGELNPDKSLEIRGPGYFMEAKLSKGFLGLGQERLTIECTSKSGMCSEITMLFADGTVEYQTRHNGPGPL